MLLRQRAAVRRSCDANVSFSIGDVPVEIHAARPELLEDITSLYTQPARVAASGPTIRIDVRRANGGGLRRLYQVYADGHPVGGTCRARHLVPFIEWGINLRVIASRNQYVQLHAASMSLGDAGCIFAGGSGYGKSTLAAGLLARGWKYFSDEFALIDRKSLTLHPFPKPICIKSGAFRVIQRLGLPFARRKDFIKARKGRVGYINPYTVGEEAVGVAAPVRYIVFPKYVPGSKAQLSPLPRALALMELAGCVFNRQAFDDQALSLLRRVVMHAECVRLVSDDLGEACAALASTVMTTAPATDAGPTHHHAARDLAPSPKRAPTPSLMDRRSVLKRGAKLAYVAPVVVALSSQHAFAGASNPSGICSTAINTGGLCSVDSDCCSGSCSLGVCD